MRLHNYWVTVVKILPVVFLTACSGAKAETLVTSFPGPSSGGSPPVAAAGGPVVVKTVYLELEVYSPERAAESAEQLAAGFGGYETNRYGWNADGGRAVSQELFVPLDCADALYARLLQMGVKRSESVVRNADGWYSYAWAQFSISYRPAHPSVVWDDHPVHPIADAFYDFAAQAAGVIFQLSVSVVLVAVVLIPIGLMILGAVTLIRWIFKG